MKYYQRLLILISLSLASSCSCKSCSCEGEKSEPAVKKANLKPAIKTPTQNRASAEEEPTAKTKAPPIVLSPQQKLESADSFLYKPALAEFGKSKTAAFRAIDRSKNKNSASAMEAEFDPETWRSYVRSIFQISDRVISGARKETYPEIVAQILQSNGLDSAEDMLRIEQGYRFESKKLAEEPPTDELAQNKLMRVQIINVEWRRHNSEKVEKYRKRKAAADGGKAWNKPPPGLDPFSDEGLDDLDDMEEE